MDKTELRDRVRELREQGRSPKEIARALRVPPSAVAPLVRELAAEQAGSGRAAPGPEVVGCWVNAGWSVGLTVDESRGWTEEVPERGIAGMVSAVVAWRHGWDKVEVCGYLVDVYCLGVKDVLGPHVMDEFALRRFLAEHYAPYPGRREVPVEFVRHLVFGAIDYAKSLGFDPLPEAVALAERLGPWTGPSAITFGRQGRPYYVEGPRDNSPWVLRTLEQTVGAGNFDYVLAEG